MAEDDELPTREQLVQAREDLIRQLGYVEYPNDRKDLNPMLVAKLKAMIEEINQALADLGEDDAQGS